METMLTSLDTCSKKIFIDLGAYTGDTLDIALEQFKDFDYFFGFEPMQMHYDILREKYLPLTKVLLFKFAASTETKHDVKLYFHKNYKTNKRYSNGSSIQKNKSNVTDDYELISTVDFPQFIVDNFTPKNYIVLKINIEGAEYSLLEKMIADDSISMINELYCEWHYNKLNGFPQSRHTKLITELNSRHFNLTGNNSDVGPFKETVSLG